MKFKFNSIFLIKKVIIKKILLCLFELFTKIAINVITALMLITVVDNKTIFFKGFKGVAAKNLGFIAYSADSIAVSFENSDVTYVCLIFSII